MNECVPILLVHGIWDRGADLQELAVALRRVGLGPVETIDLVPNDGSASMETLAEQIDVRAREVLARAGASRLDLVSFSMGALASRYWIQRGGGKAMVRRFVSIAGPHRGTLVAFGMPFFQGARQMRWGSRLVRDLAKDVNPWGSVEVHTLWTPMDLMVFPGVSGRLPQSTSDEALPIWLHRGMITQPRALRAIQSRLLA